MEVVPVTSPAGSPQLTIPYKGHCSSIAALTSMPMFIIILLILHIKGNVSSHPTGKVKGASGRDRGRIFSHDTYMGHH